MKAYIPSTHRAKECFLSKHPAMTLALAGVIVVVVCRPHELQEYKDEAKAQAFIGEIIATDEAHNGIALTRKFIGEYAAEQGEDKFIMVDDDVGFLIRKSSEVHNLREQTTQEIVEMMHAVYNNLTDTCPHVGVSMREGNCHIGIGGEDLHTMNTRICRFLAYKTDVFNSLEHGRVQFMEDFDVALQMLRMGYDNKNLGYYAQGQKQTQAAGGCSVDRTHATHEASAIGLHKHHPEFVTLVDKKNKSGGEFGTRKEVRIGWKKARKSAG